MRRSTTIRLTLLPLLASAAAVAHAQAPGETPPVATPPPGQSTGPAGPYVPPPIPTIENFGPDAAVPPPVSDDGGGDDESNAPGMTPPMPEDCQEDPELDGCPTAVWIDTTTYDGGVIHRGGFGGYFHVHGGGHGG